MLPLNLPQIRLPWRLRLWLLPFAVMLAMLACESSSPPPPTLEVQQPTSTPTQPIPITPTPSMPAEAVLSVPADPDLQAMLAQVESDRLMVSVGSLVDMHTRHVLSKTTKITPGIAAARDWLITQFQDLQNKNPLQPITLWTQDVKYTWNGFPVASQNV